MKGELVVPVSLGELEHEFKRMADTEPLAENGARMVKSYVYSPTLSCVGSGGGGQRWKSLDKDWDLKYNQRAMASILTQLRRFRDHRMCLFYHLYRLLLYAFQMTTRPSTPLAKNH